MSQNQNLGTFADFLSVNTSPNTISVSAPLTIANNLTVTGTLTLSGNTVISGANNLVLQSSVLSLHTQANLAPLTSDDGQNIGIAFHYYDTQDRQAFLAMVDTTGYLTYYNTSTDVALGAVSGVSLGTIQAASYVAGNATVYSTLNATAFSGTSNNSNYLSGNTVSDLHTYSDNMAANAYANAISYAGSVATSNADQAYSNAVTYAGLAADNAYSNAVTYADFAAANAYSNAVTYAGLAADNAYSNSVTYTNSKADNAYSNAVTYADFAAANAYSNAIAYSGNAAQAYSNATTYADNKAANAYSNAVTYAGNKADNAYSNAIAYTNTGIALKSGTTFTGLVTHTANVAVNGAIIAGGNSGMSGQFLTSNGNGNVYWSGLTSSINTGNLSAQSIFVTSGNLSIGNTQVNTDISNTGVYISNTTTNVFMQIDSFRVPTGNVGQRPASLLAGLLRYNTELSDMEYANGTAWIPLSSQETLTSNNISINNAITIGNSTVNSYINSTAAAITKIVSGNTQANSTSVNTTNFVSTTANITGNTYINKLIANSALGTNGQFLTSNSTGGIYWSTGVGNIAADAMTISVGNLSIGNTTVNTDISNNGLFIQNTSSSATLNVTGFNAGNATSNLAFYTTLIGAASVEYGPAYTINSVNLTNGPGGLGVYAPQGGAYATASNLFFVNASLMQIGNSTSYVTFRGSIFNIGTMITGNSLGIYTSNLSVNNIIANGSQGTNGQILTSNGTGMYWAAGVGNLAADAIAISVGNLSIGNSTVNTDMSNTGIFISNTTSTVTLNIATFAIGNSTVNTTINSNSIRSTNLAITTVIANGATGANGQILTANSTGGAYWGTGVANLSALAITITTGNLSIGNTTVNTDVSNNGIFISNATSSVTLNVSGLNIGNSSVNATMNSTAFAMPSATFTGNLTVNNTIFVGDSSVNTTTNTSGIYLKGNGYTVSVNTAVSVNLTTGGSIGFNGSNSYITGTITNSPGTSTGGVGIGDFCMEAWVRPSALASGDTPGVFTLMNGTGTDTGFWLYVNSGGWGVRNNTGDIVAYSVAPTINTFYHVAVSRSSGTLTLYINGVGVATTSTNYTFSDTTFSVGAFNSTYFNGYISNIRYVWASPVYTSNFTPPTSPLGVYGTTELLLVQSTSATYLTETSGYSVAITTAGAPFYSTLSPFSALTYSTVNVGGFYTSGKVNAASVNSAVYTVGSVFIANTSKITVGVPVLANGSTGTAGQVLTSNGSTGSPYWTTQATVTNLAADAITISVGNLSIGNTTVNTDVSNNGVFISNTTSSVTLNVSGLNIGNSTINATMNSTAFAMPSATFTGNLTVNNTLTVTGNLILAGSTTFVNSTVITTKDLNIIFANGAANSLLTDGAGIVAGTSANLVFDDPTKSWQTNVNITPYTNNLSLGATSKLFNLYANQIIANGSMGTAGQILTSNGTSTYWSTGATVTNLAADAITISVGNLSIGNTTVNTDVSNNGVFISNTTSSVTLNVSGLTIGNATVNSTVNSSVFSGTSLTSNNASYLGTVAAASYVKNTDSRTLSGNLYFTGANNYFDGQLVVGLTGDLQISPGAGIKANGTFGTAGYILATNATSVYWTPDNSSTAYSNAIAYSGNAALAYANAIAYSGNAALAYANAIAYSGNSALAYANAIAYTNTNIALLTGASFTGLVTHTANLAVNGAIIAGGNSGTVGQVLTSNGSGNVYWSTVSGGGGGSVNVAAQYTWTNTQTFSNVITFNSNVNIGTIDATAGILVTNTQIVIGNNSVNTTINSTSFTGSANSANNSSYLGGTAAASYVNTSGAYTITGVHTYNANIIFGTSTNISANGSYGSVGQVLTSNGTSLYWATDQAVGNVTANIVTSNTLSANHVVVNNDLSVVNGTFSNVSMYSDRIFIGNSIVNTTINSTSIAINGSVGTTGQVLTSNGTVTSWQSVSAGVNSSAQYAFTNTISFSNTVTFGNATVNAAISTNSTVTSFSGTSNNSLYFGGYGLSTFVTNTYLSTSLTNVVNTTANFTYTGTQSYSNTVTFSSAVTHTANITVNGAIIAGGSNGTVGQVLTSNGTGNVYWSSPGAATVNTAAQYSFTNTISFNSILGANNVVQLNGSNGSAGQVLTSNGNSNAYWSTVSSSSGTGATGGDSNGAFYENATTITANYSLTAGKNAGTFGPVTINSGITVTVPSGSVWTIV